jgi:hypothetical protein
MGQCVTWLLACYFDERESRAGIYTFGHGIDWYLRLANSIWLLRFVLVRRVRTSVFLFAARSCQVPGHPRVLVDYAGVV